MHDLDQLLSKLKKADTKYAQIGKALKIMYWLFIPLYSIMYIHTYLDNGNLSELIGGIFFVSSFLVLALFMRNMQKEYESVDYSAPTLLMLKKAANRYTPFRWKKSWFLLSIIFMDIGLALNPRSYSVWEIQIFFLSLVAVGIAIGLIIWHVKYKRMRDVTYQLIDEIEN